MFRFDQLIRRDMIIRDVKQRHPATIPVFEDLALSRRLRRLRYRNGRAQERTRRPGRGGRAECGRVRTKGETRRKCKQLPINPPRRSCIHKRNQPLDVFFSPKTVAVIGATENPGSVGRTVLWNLISSPFGGTVYPGQPEAAQRAGHQGLRIDLGHPGSRSTWP